MITLSNFRSFDVLTMSMLFCIQKKRQKRNNIRKKNIIVRSFSYLSKPVKIETGICKIQEMKIFKRFMISSKCIYAARAAYHFASLISNNVENLKKENTSDFITQVVHNAIDYNKGIPQHKTTLMKHLSNQKVLINQFYDAFNEKTLCTDIIKYEPNIFVDFRTNNELPVLEAYIKAFHPDIDWVFATGDARSASFFKAQQTNVDFWVQLKKDKNLQNKFTYQDEKSGMDMLKHTTRGSIGLLCYDEKGNNVQMTSQPITIENLIAHDKKKIEKIQKALKQDDVILDENTFVDAQHMVDQMQQKPFEQVINLHNDFQNLLWKEFQNNPQFPRSMSFIFIKQIINEPSTDKEIIFSKAFQSKLKPDYLYNLDKKGDTKELYHAFIYAGKKVDPYFVEKLYHMHQNGIMLTHDVLTVLKELTKHAVH